MLVIVAGGAWYGYRYYKSMPERQDLIPTAKVQRSDVVIRAYSRGELKPAEITGARPFHDCTGHTQWPGSGPVSVRAGFAPR